MGLSKRERIFETETARPAFREPTHASPELYRPFIKSLRTRLSLRRKYHRKVKNGMLGLEAKKN